MAGVSVQQRRLTQRIRRQRIDMRNDEQDEPMDGGLRARVVQLEQAQAAARLTVLETWKQQAAIADAHREGQWAVMQQSIASVSTDVGEIKDNQKWVIRLIIGGIIMALVAFLIGGGLGIQKL